MGRMQYIGRMQYAPTGYFNNGVYVIWHYYKLAHADVIAHVFCFYQFIMYNFTEII